MWCLNMFVEDLQESMQDARGYLEITEIPLYFCTTMATRKMRQLFYVMRNSCFIEIEILLASCIIDGLIVGYTNGLFL